MSAITSLPSMTRTRFDRCSTRTRPVSLIAASVNRDAIRVGSADRERAGSSGRALPTPICTHPVRQGRRCLGVDAAAENSGCRLRSMRRCSASAPISERSSGLGHRSGRSARAWSNSARSWSWPRSSGDPVEGDRHPDHDFGPAESDLHLVPEVFDPLPLAVKRGRAADR